MYQYDAIHNNIGSIPGTADYVAGYVSGTPDIVWDQADYNRFPHAVKEYIDQGYGTPWRNPTVIDVENGAFTVADVPGLVNKYPQVKVYCTTSSLPGLNRVYHGNVWVADPGIPDAVVLRTVPVWHKLYPNLRITMVQNYWGTSYDRTLLVPVPSNPVVHANINGFNVTEPTAVNVPAVVGWIGDGGVITYRQANIPYSIWEHIPWVK